MLDLRSQSISELILPAIFFIMSSTVYIWLIKSEIRYSFFLFAFLLSFSFYISLTGSKIGFKKISIILPHFNLAILDILPLTLTLILFAFIIIQFETIVTFVIAILVVYFVPGYVLLRVLDFKSKYTVLEFVVLSLGLSIPISAMVYTGVIWFTHDIRQMLLILSFLILSSLPVVIPKSRKYVFFDNENSTHRICITMTISELLLWGVIIIFFIFNIYTLYPNITHSDIITNYSNSLMLSKSTVSDLHLPWFIFLETILLILAPQPIEIFQTGLVLLNIILIFAFYILSKAYLKKLDERAPIISTVIWCTFSGFGWISLWLFGSYGYKFVFLDLWVGQTPWLWLWFRGISLGFILLFIMMYMLTRQDIQKTIYIFLMVLLSIGLTLTHLSEIILFTYLIFGFSVLRSNLYMDLRLKDTSLALAITNGFMILLTVVFVQVVGFSFDGIAPYMYILLFIASITTYIVLQMDINGIIIKTLELFRINKVLKILTTLLLFFWLALFFEWLINNYIYSNIVNEVWAVPWATYPVLLGISGLITVACITFSKDLETKNHLVTFLIIALLGIIFGRLITFVNLNLTWVQYVERRITPFVFSVISIPSGVVLIKTLNHINTSTHKSVFKHSLSLILISSLVIFGFSSTALAIEHQNQITPIGNLEPNEVKAIEFLNVNKDYYANLYTVTSRSSLATEYIAMARKPLIASEIFWGAKSPEFILNVLADSGPDTIFFLHTRDMKEINKIFQSSYLSFLIDYGTLLFNSSTVKVTEFYPLFPPLPKGNIALILPEDSEIPAYYLHTLLSLSQINYTSVMIKDIKSIQKYTCLIVANEDTALKLMDYKEIYGLEFQILLVFNFDGYGRLAGELLNSQNPNYEDNIPFIVQRAYHNFELYYYDVLNLTNNFSNSTSYLILINSLDNIFHDEFGEKYVNIFKNHTNTKNRDLTKNLIGFKEGVFTGEAYLTGTSIILHCSNLITINDLQYTCPQDSSVIVPINFTEFYVIAKHVKIEKGQGYYSNILAENVTIVFKGSPVKIALGFGSKQELEFKGSEIRISADSLILQIRNPKISITGSGELKQFYGYGDLQLYKRYGALSFTGQDFIFNGTLDFSVIFGDTVTIVDQFRVHNTFQRQQPLYTFNENAAILRSIVYLIPLIAVSVFLKIGQIYLRARAD